MTEIEIPDEPGGSGQGPDDTESPYKNLLVPLVVVPAAVVMVIVMIYALFGAIAGEEATPAENVQRLLEGGVNEREQAAFNLVRQVLEDWHAEAENREGEWHIDASLMPRIQSAWEETRHLEEEGDVSIPLALSIILARMGDSEAVAFLAEVTQLSNELDPDGKYRTYASFSLGNLGPSFSEPDRIVSARALIALLDDPDEGLRCVGAIALQTLPTAETVPALVGVLGAGALELRLNAALSLVRLGDPSGESVLLEAIHRTPYHEERARRREKWTKEVRVSESRVKALEALVALGRAPSGEVLREMAAGDSDPHVQEAALKALESAGADASGS